MNWERTYSLLGTPFRVRCDNEQAADRLQLLLEALEAPAAPVPAGGEFFLRNVDGHLELLRGSDRIRSAPKWPELVSFMLAEMNRAALANYAGFACHAGVVAAAGKAIALPAASQGGKSTITSACVLAGLDYVSDEALCIGFEDRTVAPYPRPIELSEWSREHLRIHAPAAIPTAEGALIGIGEIGGRVASESLELAHLVVIEIAAGSPSLRQLPRSGVVTNLLRYSFNHYKHPLQSFRLAGQLAERCTVWRLAYESALEAAEILRTKLTG